MPMPFSPAGQSLGLNNLGRIPGLGDALGAQVAGETDEERRRRLQQLQQQRLLGVGGSSAAATSLFGGSVRQYIDMQGEPLAKHFAGQARSRWLLFPVRANVDLVAPAAALGADHVAAEVRNFSFGRIDNSTHRSGLGAGTNR
jgi:hypothetical protein